MWKTLDANKLELNQLGFLQTSYTNQLSKNTTEGEGFHPGQSSSIAPL